MLFFSVHNFRFHWPKDHGFQGLGGRKLILTIMGTLNCNKIRQVMFGMRGFTKIPIGAFIFYFSFRKENFKLQAKRNVTVVSNCNRGVSDK